MVPYGFEHGFPQTSMDYHHFRVLFAMKMAAMDTPHRVEQTSLCFRSKGRKLPGGWDDKVPLVKGHLTNPQSLL